MAKLPGQVYEGVSTHADDILKGMEFGFRAAGVVMTETADIVIRDVISAILPSVVQKAALYAKTAGYTAKAVKKTIEYIADPPPSAGLIAGRLMSQDQIRKTFSDAKERAERVSIKIQEIKKNIYDDSPDQSN